MSSIWTLPLWTACLYWGGVAVNAAMIKRRTGNSPSLRPRQALDYWLWLAWASIIGLWSTSPWITMSENALYSSLASSLVGYLLITTGFLGTWWCYITLGNAWAISVNESTTNQLIESGPYRHVRHPIYALQWSIIFGSFLACPSIALLISLAILTVAMHKKATFEESALTAIFNDDYRSYMSRTGRFLPSLRNSRLLASPHQQ